VISFEFDGSGSRQAKNIRMRLDPDPQHCFNTQHVREILRSNRKKAEAVTEIQYR